MIHAGSTDLSLYPLLLQPWRPGDEHALLRCHNEVFAGPAEGGARSLAHWRWKYVDNPVGQTPVLLAWHTTGEVVGVYGGYPIAVSCRGNRMVAAHSVDHCIRPEWLRHGGDDGLFPRMGREFFDSWLGNGDGRFMFIYGLPVRGWSSGSKKLGWQIVRDWNITFHELSDDAAVRKVSDRLQVRAVGRYDEDVDALFAQIEPSLAVATVRDRTYLNWRYADHPDRDYVLFECRDRNTSELLGICVYGTGNAGRQHTSYIVDWLHAAGDDDVMVALLAAAEEQARRDGTGMICAVWNPSDPRFLAVQQLGYQVRATPWFLALESSLYDQIYFREGWYFTLGDSDLA